MALKLIKGSLQYKNEIIEMIKEWKSYNDTHNANTSGVSQSLCKPPN